MSIFFIFLLMIFVFIVLKAFQGVSADLKKRQRRQPGSKQPNRARHLDDKEKSAKKPSSSSHKNTSSKQHQETFIVKKKERIDPLVPENQMPLKKIHSPASLLLNDTNNIRTAILMREVIGPPRASQPYEPIQ